MRIDSGIYPGQRNQMFIVLAVFLGFTLWFARDGWIKWPQENLNKFVQPQLPKHVDGLKANPRVTMANIQKVQPGMSTDQLRSSSSLGEPALIHEATYWYAGPAAYAAIAVTGDKVIRVVKADESREHSESELFSQKLIAVCLGIGLFWYLVHLLRMLRINFVVDDQGLHVNRRLIAWDQMTSLETGDYAKKERVTLHYTQAGQPRTLPLKSQVINKFVPIVEAICERKGFITPFAKTGSESKAGASET